jgi:F420-0:gamma-glutamyl ligase
MLAGAQGASTDQLCSLVCGLLDAAGLTAEQRIDVLGGALVAEAVRPHWAESASPDEAHDALRVADGELADAVEAVAQVLLGRAETREAATAAIAELDRMLNEA